MFFAVIIPVIKTTNDGEFQAIYMYCTDTSIEHYSMLLLFLQTCVSVNVVIRAFSFCCAGLAGLVYQ